MAASDDGVHVFVDLQAGTRICRINLTTPFKWTDPKTGEARSRAGMQAYRIENDKLAETWLMLQPLGTAWSDAVAQEHRTSPPPIKKP